MRLTIPLHSVPGRRWTVVGCVGLALVASGLAAVPASAERTRTEAGVTTADATQPEPATVFRISSFNVLGAGHTDDGGRRKRWASGWKRQGWANQLIQDRSIDVVGFQELQDTQFERFSQDLGNEFAVFPGDTMSSAAMQNSIAWRTDVWSLVDARTIKVPYFDGNRIAKPYVLLRHQGTGQLAWFYNTHHPADARGPAQKWRDRATAIELDLFHRLYEEFPGVPVFATGDMNDREEVFCPYVLKSQMRAANGGGVRRGTCVTPDNMKVDWVFGSRRVAFTSYRALRSDLVRKTTDHPMINATVSIPPAWSQSLPVSRVVVLEVDGLRSDALQVLGAEGAPHLTAMMEEGASTLNARTSLERTTTIPNVASIGTGRPVRLENGGHGITRNDGAAPTVHSRAGRYISSVFDLVHNDGRSTALYSSDPRLALLDRSWNEVNGGRDPYGLDDGRDKIDHFVLTRGDRGMFRRLRRDLVHSPARFTLAHASTVARVGHQHRWMSRAYLDAVRVLDRRIGSIVRTIDRKRSLRRHTMVVVTATNGGSGRHQGARKRIANYRVPLLVRGPGIAAGADLYDLNPAYPDPGTSRPSYDGPQPLRNGAVANLVLAALGVPAIPGSRMNPTQSVSPVGE